MTIVLRFFVYGNRGRKSLFYSFFEVSSLECCFVDELFIRKIIEGLQMFAVNKSVLVRSIIDDSVDVVAKYFNNL